jgi:hypothetical protein
MSTGDLIALVGYYVGILAIAVAYFSSQIDAWKNRALTLEAEWSPTEQKTNTQFKLRQQGEKRTLLSTRPFSALFAPIVFEGVLVFLGYLALKRAKTDVSTSDIEELLLLPSLLLVIVYFVYAATMIRGTTKKLNSLAN